MSRSRQTPSVIVEGYIDRGCRPRAIKIYANNVDFSNSPAASRHDEIISQLIVKCVVRSLKVLRNGCIRSWIVGLVVKDGLRSIGGGE